MQGIAIQHDVTEAGVVDQPRDLTAATFQSYSTSGIRTGIGTPDGRFELPVAGAVGWLELTLGGDRVLLPGDSPHPDASAFRFGRGDAQWPAAATRVGLELSGLAAWQAGDSLQIVAPNVGLVMAGPENELAHAPEPGATALGGQALDWKASMAPLVDAGKGDTTWVTQMAAASSGAVHYRTLARAGIAHGFTLRDGQPAALTATLAPVAQDRTLALHVQAAQFAALVPQIGSGASPAAAATVAIRALPEPLAHANHFFATHYEGLPSLVEFGPLSGTTDSDATVQFGDPFASQGARWTEFATLVYAATVPIPVPSARAIGSLPARMVAAVPVDALAATGALAPAISPVRNARIAGRSLDAAVAGTGMSPTVAWDAPAIGTATNYAVTVHAVAASPTGVTTTPLATLYTRSTSLALPASLLAAGSSYVLVITAIAAPGADLAARPFIGALPFASADHVTALVTP